MLVLGAATPHGPRVAASYSFLVVIRILTVAKSLTSRVALDSSASTADRRLSCIQRSSITQAHRIGILPPPPPPPSSVTTITASRPLRPTIDSIYVPLRRLFCVPYLYTYWLSSSTPLLRYELDRAVSVFQLAQRRDHQIHGCIQPSGLVCAQRYSPTGSGHCSSGCS